MWLTPQRPTHEPSGSCSALSQSTPARAASESARPTAASISSACAVTSALGGAITSPKAPNGSPRARDRVVDAPSVGVGDAVEREHDLGRVVDVGIAVVGELERPTTGRELRPADGPVPLDVNLLVEQPVCGAH